MNPILKKIVLCSIFLFTFVIEASEPIENLQWVADGVNEGVRECHHPLYKNKIWANAATVIKASFSTEESVILDLNDPLASHAASSILYYYIVYSHALLQRCSCCVAKIAVIADREDASAFLNHLEEVLFACHSNLSGVKTIEKKSPELFSYFLPNVNVEISFCKRGSKESLLKKMAKNDITLVYSLADSLNPDIKPGMILVPTHWIPFKNGTLFEEDIYFTDNHLVKVFPTIIERQKQAELSAINSINPKKSQKARFLTLQDFKVASMLEFSGKFSPELLPETFSRSSNAK